MSAQKRRNDTVKFCVLNYTLYTLTLFGEGGGGGGIPGSPLHAVYNDHLWDHAKTRLLYRDGLLIVGYNGDIQDLPHLSLEVEIMA